MAPKLRLGISACLLGERVRWDGTDRLDPFLRDRLGAFADYVPVCPEAEAGLGVPREPMRLEGDPAAPRLVGCETLRDLTGVLGSWARRRLPGLAGGDLQGFIFKSDSPSCGLRRVPVQAGGGASPRMGSGLFARAFAEAFPLVPVEEESGLRDPGTYRGFVEAVFTLERWRAASSGRSRAALVGFHARHKYLLMARSPVIFRRMGRLPAELGRRPLPEIRAEYGRLLAEALRARPTPRKHADALMHMLGHLKRVLDPGEKKRALQAIERVRLGGAPPGLALGILREFVRRHGEPYLASQHYLRPDPMEERLLGLA